MPPTSRPDEYHLRLHQPSLVRSGLLRHRESVELKHVGEASLLTKTFDVFSSKRMLGGEGVLYIQAARSSGGSYWFLSLLSLQGRASAFWPMALYVLYTCVMVTMLTRLLSDYFSSPEAARTFQGLQSGMSMVGTALFFLQTFRTNSAYQRWWEGRCLWGAAATEVLALCRTVSSGSIKHRALARCMLRWAASYLLTLKAGLRGENELEEVDDVLSEAEAAELEATPKAERILFTLTKLQAAWGEAQDHPQRVLRRCADTELERIVPSLTASVMGMRRIANTPMPFSYISHLRSFLVIWLAAMPVLLVYYMSYWAIIVCTVIGYALIGMEAISLEIESPFGRDFNDLPMDNMTLDVLRVLANAYDTTSRLPDLEPDPLGAACVAGGPASEPGGSWGAMAGAGVVNRGGHGAVAGVGGEGAANDPGTAARATARQQAQGQGLSEDCGLGKERGDGRAALAADPAAAGPWHVRCEVSPLEAHAPGKAAAEAQGQVPLPPIRGGAAWSAALGHGDGAAGNERQRLLVPARPYSP